MKNIYYFKERGYKIQLVKETCISFNLFRGLQPFKYTYIIPTLTFKNSLKRQKMLKNITFAIISFILIVTFFSFPTIYLWTKNIYSLTEFITLNLIMAILLWRIINKIMKNHTENIEQKELNKYIENSMKNYKKINN